LLLLFFNFESYLGIISDFSFWRNSVVDFVGYILCISRSTIKKAPGEGVLNKKFLVRFSLSLVVIQSTLGGEA
jgi:hypothetical protein